MTLQLGNKAAPLRIVLPAGDVPAEAVLPALRTVVNAVVAHAAAAAEARGRPISCDTGCAACCRHLVLLSDIEARVLADLVAQMPEPRQSVIRARFAAVRERMAQAGLTAPVDNAARLPAEELSAVGAAYFELGIACPFLDDERCSIYADRPLACRKVAVTSPAEFCSYGGDARIDYLRVPSLGTAVLLITSDEEPPQPAAVLLPFMLDWIETDRMPAQRRGADQWMQRFVHRLANS